jgi:membrane protein DedA with SNARE-associated domain
MEGSDVADWVISIMEDGGYLMVAAMMFLENVFPPIPSELVMPLAGYTAQQGHMNIWLVVLFGTLGSLAGALFWYYVGLWLGCERLKRFAGRHGRLLTLTPDEIDQADAWFDKHGAGAVFFGRLIPTVRTFISVPAGLSDMTLRRFLVYTTAGTAVWTAALGFAGWYLGGQYEVVETYLSPVSNVIAAVIVLAYAYRVITFQPRAKS